MSIIHYNGFDNSTCMSLNFELIGRGFESPWANISFIVRPTWPISNCHKEARDWATWCPVNYHLCWHDIDVTSMSSTNSHVTTMWCPLGLPCGTHVAYHVIIQMTHGNLPLVQLCANLAESTWHVETFHVAKSSCRCHPAVNSTHCHINPFFSSFCQTLELNNFCIRCSLTQNLHHWKALIKIFALM